MANGLCSRCAVDPPVLGQRYCRRCKNLAQCKYRRRHPLAGDARRKDNARSYAATYRKRGKLIAPVACELCGAEGRLEMHHPDYDRPLLVLFLHRECHAQVHVGGCAVDLTRARFRELAARA